MARSRYEPLGGLLVAAAARGERDLQLRFEEIDKVVGGLPPSARKYREWWANSGQPHSTVWRGVGWRVSGVNQSSGNWVRFERDEKTPTASAPQAGVSVTSSRHGATKRRHATKSIDWDSRSAVGEVRVTVSANWREAGPITVDANGEIEFPDLPRAPGVYRMTLTGAPGRVRPRMYVGETEVLQRRMAHYRNPGPTQSTNIRLKAALRAHLSSGGVAAMAFIAGATVRTATEERPAMPLDLSRKAARRMLENAALVSTWIAGDADIENIE